MKYENGKIEGDIVVYEPFALHGMVTGSISVAAGGTLQLYGMCCGDLIVEHGGVAAIDGTVGGNVVNHGQVELRGVVNGNVLSPNGTFTRTQAAIVRGAVEP